jgi:regulator of replication initiation timing
MNPNSDNQISERRQRWRLMCIKMRQDERSALKGSKASLYAQFIIQQRELYNLSEQNEDLLEENATLKRERATGWNEAVKLSEDKKVLSDRVTELEHKNNSLSSEVIDLKVKRSRAVEILESGDDRKKTRVADE